MDLEAKLQEIILTPAAAAAAAASPRRAVFVLTLSIEHPTEEQIKRIHATWEQAWIKAKQPIPTLLMLPRDMHLQAMSDAQLHEHGLVRIKPEE
jgi:hypothetical protein